MRNFSCKDIGFISIMNEMGTILKPLLPFLYSEVLKVCALFGCSHISGYIKLSLRVSTYKSLAQIIHLDSYLSITSLPCQILLWL